MSKKIKKCRAEEGCDQEAKKLGFCGTHYTQVRRGVRDASSGALLRELRVTYKGVLCKVEDCKASAFCKGFCSAHYQKYRFNRIDEDGKETDKSEWKSFFNPNRTTLGRSPNTCSLEGCDRERADKETGFCAYHIRRVKLGIIDKQGQILREEYRRRRYGPDDLCLVEGCDRQARSNNFCIYHAGRFTAGLIDEKGIALRKPSIGKPRQKVARWKSHGYIKIRVSKDHPFCDKDGMVFEHRRVMELAIGQYLNPWEIVHHKNGVKDDNRLENLELMDKRRHPKAIERSPKEAGQVLLQQDDLPKGTRKRIKSYLDKKKE